MSDPVSLDPNTENAHHRGAGTRLLEIVCALLVATMMVLLFIQVFGRYALSDPPDWTEELARAACVYATFVGGALAVARNAHLRIDTVVKLMPASVQPWIRTLTTIAAIVFLGYVLYYSYVLLPRLANQELVTVPVSKAWFFAAVPVGCALMLVYELHRLWVELRSLAHAGASARS